MGAYYCQRCSFCCEQWRVYVRHSFGTHSSELTFNFRCGIDDCPRLLRTYSGWQSHVTRNHPGSNLSPSPLPLRSAPEVSPLEVEESTTPDEGPFEIEGAMDVPLNMDENRVSRSAALFLLSMKEKHRLTQTCIDYAVSQVHQMVEFIVEDLQSSVENAIEQQLADYDVDVPNVSRCFSDINPFEGLETEHKQIKFWKKNFRLIVSRGGGGFSKLKGCG